jgi:hypothetical protein
MARYGEQGNGSGGRNLLILVLAIILAAFFFFWRSHLNPGTLPITPQTQTSETLPEKPGQLPPGPCKGPTMGAAGVFTVHFDFDKSDIRGEDLHWVGDAANAYSELVRTLKDCGGTQQAVVRLGVVGHTDTAGPHPDLAVQTPDNTPNAANRRAVMTIIVQAVPVT